MVTMTRFVDDGDDGVDDCDNIPGVNFVSVASAKTDGVGSHVNFVVPGCVFGDCDDPVPVVGNIPQRRRLAGR